MLQSVLDGAMAIFPRWARETGFVSVFSLRRLCRNNDSRMGARTSTSRGITLRSREEVKVGINGSLL